MFSRLAVRAVTITVLTVALSALLASGAQAGPAGPGPGNSTNAKQCYKGAWQNLVDANGVAFASQEACVSYAAKGGVMSPKPTASLVLDIGTCTTGDTPGKLDCTGMSAVASGLLPGSQTELCEQTSEGQGCHDYQIVDPDGTFPAIFDSFDDDCMEGTTYWLTGTTATGTAIEGNHVTCSL